MDKHIFVNGIDMTGADKRILLVTNEDLTTQDGYGLKKALEDYFPGSKFVVVSGAQVIVVPDAPSYDFEVIDE